MKALAWALLFVLFVHLLAAAGLVGWLYASDRLSTGRVSRAVDLFKMTIHQEKKQQRHATQLEARAQQTARRAARLQAVADGPRTLQDHLAAEQQRGELAAQQKEKLRRDAQDLRRRIENAKAALTKRKKEFDAQRQAFEKLVDRRTKKMKDQDFQKAVRMYEQLRPTQTKQMFEQLMSQGKTAQVVDYLAAMQLRKAAGVLKEFQSGPEIAQATMLVQKLRDRGVFPTGQETAKAVQP